MTSQAKSHIVKQLTHTGLAHYSTKENEQEDVASRYAYGSTIDTFGVSKEVVGKTGPVIATVHEHTGHGASPQTISNKYQAQNG